jgi:hypothetical protein
VDHEKRQGAVYHSPQPHKNSVFIPGGLIDMIDPVFSDLLFYGLIMGFNGLGCPVDDFLLLSQNAVGKDLIHY